MYIERHEIAVTTDGSGAATAYTSVTVSGFIQAIRYVPDGTSPLDTGFDATITGAVSGIEIVTVTNGGTSAFSTYPRAATASVANAAALYASGGTAVNDLIPVAQEKVKIVIAQGGASKLGTFHVYIG